MRVVYDKLFDLVRLLLFLQPDVAYCCLCNLLSYLTWFFFSFFEAQAIAFFEWSLITNPRSNNLSFTIVWACETDGIPLFRYLFPSTDLSGQWHQWLTYRQIGLWIWSQSAQLDLLLIATSIALHHFSRQLFTVTRQSVEPFIICWIVWSQIAPFQSTVISKRGVLLIWLSSLTLQDLEESYGWFDMIYCAHVFP